jgi:hypothetical protein
MNRAVVTTLLACVWLVRPATASVIETKLSQPRLLRPGESDVAYIPFGVDFDGDGTNEITFLPHSGGINVYIRASSRIVIRSSPPPNIGGLVASVPLNFTLGSEIALDGHRWWEGGPLGSPDQQIYGDRVLSLSIVVMNLTGIANIVQMCDFLSQNAVVGVEFRIGTNTHFGYVHLDFRPEHQVWLDGGGGYIYGWAYETQPGAAVATRPLAVPELPVPCRIERAASNRFALSWRSEATAVYRIQGMPHVTNSFLDMSENFTAFSTNSDVLVTPPTNGSSYFWRVVRIY